MQPASRWGYEECCNAPQPSADEDHVHITGSVRPYNERFLAEISEHDWGRVATFKDSGGNDLQLYEPPSS
jgi:hypothetical protein